MTTFTAFRIGSIAAGAVVLAAVLAGCSGATVPVSDLDRAATAADAVPEGTATEMLQNVDPGSVRLVGERAGLNIYLGESNEDGYCILLGSGSDGAGADGDSSSSDGGIQSVGCGGIDGELQTQQGIFRIASDDMSPGDGWDAVSENVYYREP